MAKAAIARHYVIEYTIPGVDDSVRSMMFSARFPVREIDRFRRVNPKAAIVRVYDRHSKVEVVTENDNQSPGTQSLSQMRTRTKDQANVN